MAFENTQNKLDELRNLTWQNGKLIEQNQQLLDQLENGAGAIGSEIIVGKQSLVDAIEYKGGTSNADKSLQGIADDIKNINVIGTGNAKWVEGYEPKTFTESLDLTYLTEITSEQIISFDNVNFKNLSYLRYVNFPNITYISIIQSFLNCISLEEVIMPSLTGFHSLSEANNPFNTSKLKNIVFGKLNNLKYGIAYTNLTNLRNFTIGNLTDTNLPLSRWTATNVINEGPSGIDELNSNLYNNLLTKLYDHSNDGETRTLRLGWLAYVTQENIDYANSKGWTLTT
jgi:hypothetical protein